MVSTGVDLTDRSDSQERSGGTIDGMVNSGSVISLHLTHPDRVLITPVLVMAIIRAN